jgi:hypothetical protein
MVLLPIRRFSEKLTGLSGHQVYVRYEQLNETPYSGILMQTKTTLLIAGIIVVVVAATMAIRVESVSAAGTGSPESAKSFAPGQGFIPVTPGGATSSVPSPPPGQISGGPGGASSSAPGSTYLYKGERSIK